MNKHIHSFLKIVSVFLLLCGMTAAVSAQEKSAEKFDLHSLTPDKALMLICEKMDSHIREKQFSKFSPKAFERFLNLTGFQKDPEKNVIDVTRESLRAECVSLAKNQLAYNEKKTGFAKQAESLFQTKKTGRVVRFETVRNQAVKGFFYEASDTGVLVNDTRYRWKIIKREYWHLFSQKYAEQDRRNYIAEQQKKLDLLLTAESEKLFRKNWMDVAQHNVYFCGSFYDPDGKKWIDLIPLLEKEFKLRINAENEKRRIAEDARRQQEEQRRIAEEKRKKDEAERLKEEQAKQQKEAQLKRLHEQLQEEARKQAEEEHLRLKKLWNEGNRSFSEKRAKLHLQNQQIAKEIAALRKEEELAHKNRRRNEPTQKIQNLREDLMFANRKLILKQNELELLQEQDQLWKERAATVENYKQAVSSTHFERIMKDVTEKREAISTRIKDLKQEMNDLRNYMNDIRSELQGCA